MMEKEIYRKEFIVSTIKRRGSGNSGSPVRVIKQLFTDDGDLVAEKDELGGYSIEQMIAFGEYMRNPDAVICSDPCETVIRWQNKLI